MAPTPVTRERVLAFRAAAHSLAHRRPARDLAPVAGACGIQDTPPGNAEVSLAARLDVAAPVAAGAVADRTLVLTWSLRGAPHLVPPADLALFTLGAAPAPGTTAGLWGQPERALAEVEEAMVAALDAGPRTKAELSAAVTARLPAELTPWCRPCRANHPSESVFRAAPLLGRLVLTSTAPVTLARARAWLGADATGDVEALRAGLLRRYLHCYAPSTAGHFADWAGIARADARQRWAALAGELVPVQAGRKAFVLAGDLEALAGAEPGGGVRLLPAKDAYLQARDRDLLLPEPAARKRVFAVLGGPGVVLHDGAPVASWRGSARGGRYQVAVEPFGPLRRGLTAAIEAEAERVAVARGHRGAVVSVADG